MKRAKLRAMEMLKIVHWALGDNDDFDKTLNAMEQAWQDDQGQQSLSE